jgi:hypothetical protein
MCSAEMKYSEAVTGVICIYRACVHNFYVPFLRGSAFVLGSMPV